MGLGGCWVLSLLMSEEVGVMDVVEIRVLANDAINLFDSKVEV